MRRERAKAGIDVGWVRRKLGRASSVLAVALALCACGDDMDILGPGHTVHGSLWTSFYATVTEHYSAPSFTGGSAQNIDLTDIWSVDNTGLAQYLSNQPSLWGNEQLGAPQTIAVKKLDNDALTHFKNTLARYHVYSWPSIITCNDVTCKGNEGAATLDINLNGDGKTITWPLSATGLPTGLEAMVQNIKDAV